MMQMNESEKPSWTPPRRNSLGSSKRHEKADVSTGPPHESRRKSSKSSKRHSGEQFGSSATKPLRHEDAIRKSLRMNKERRHRRFKTMSGKCQPNRNAPNRHKKSSKEFQYTRTENKELFPNTSGATTFVYRVTRTQPPIQYAENPNCKSISIESPIRHTPKPKKGLSKSPIAKQSTPTLDTTPLHLVSASSPFSSPLVPKGNLSASPLNATPPLPDEPPTPPIDGTLRLAKTKEHHSPSPIKVDCENSSPQGSKSFDMFEEPCTPPRSAIVQNKPPPQIVERLHFEYEEFLMSCEENPQPIPERSQSLSVELHQSPVDSNLQPLDTITQQDTPNDNNDVNDVPETHFPENVSSPASSSSTSSLSSSTTSSSSSPSSSSPETPSKCLSPKLQDAAAAMFSGDWNEEGILLASDDELLSKAAKLRQHVVAKRLLAQQQQEDNDSAFAVVDWEDDETVKQYEPVKSSQLQIKKELTASVPEPEDMLILLQSQQLHQQRPAISLKLNVTTSHKTLKTILPDEEEDFTFALSEKDSVKKELKNENKKSPTQKTRPSESRKSVLSTSSSRHRRETLSPKRSKRRSRTPIRRRSRSPLSRSKRSSRSRTSPSIFRHSRSPIKRHSLSPPRKNPQFTLKPCGRPHTPPHPAPPSPSPSPPPSTNWNEPYPSHPYASYDELPSEESFTYRESLRSLSPKRMDLDHRIANALNDHNQILSYGKYHGGQCGPSPIIDHPGYNILLDDSTFYYDDQTIESNHTFANSSNLIEIVQSASVVEPFAMQKGNVLEIVPKGDAEPQAAMILHDQSEQNARKEHRLRRKQEREKKRMEKFMRKEKLKLEIKSLLEFQNNIIDENCITTSVDLKLEDDDVSALEMESVFVKAVYDPKAPLGKSCLRSTNAIDESRKKVLFADGVRPGDGTSASDSDDTTPLPLRDRNKRAIKKRLDSRQRKKMNKASKQGSHVDESNTAQSYGHDQVASKLFIDPELENMPPPSPPPGDPPLHLPQPTLRITKEDEAVPKMIYFHYNPKDNFMYVSPFSKPAPQQKQVTQDVQHDPILTPPSSSSPSSEVVSPTLLRRPIAPPLPPPTVPTLPHWSDTMPPPLLGTSAWEPIAAPPPSPLFHLRTPSLQPPQPGTPPPIQINTSFCPPPIPLQHSAPPLLPHPPPLGAHLSMHRNPIVYNRPGPPLMMRHIPPPILSLPKPPLLGEHNLIHLGIQHHHHHHNQTHHHRPLLSGPPPPITAPLLSTPPHSVHQLHHMMQGLHRDPNNML